MNQKSNSLQLTQEHSKNEWRYMLVLLVLGSLLGVLIHNSATKPVLISEQHAANEARDVTPKQLSAQSNSNPSASEVNQLASGTVTK